MLKTFLLTIGISCFSIAQMTGVQLESVYQQRPSDPEAVYFTVENFNITNDGKTDVSLELQNAINQVKKEKNFGILYIPEGKYKISRTIYIPPAVRLIGFGTSRPEIFLAKNSPGYQIEVPDDKGKAKYMFWFTGGIVSEGQPIRDAGAGTFYSALSNINLRIEDGNPFAVALRTHFAQHSFISHVNIYIGKGKAGLFDVGNELENVAFYGGNYGIYTTKSSPGWPVMMVDAYFEGQREAALRCQESGLAIVNLQVKNVPTVFSIDPNYADKLFVENSSFENISGPALIISNENNSNNQITLRNVICKNVPVLVKYRRSETETRIQHKIYTINNYAHGLQMDDMLAKPEYRTVCDVVPLQKFPDQPAKRDIPDLPPMSSWINIRDLGAKGDGETDDTQIFQEALNKYDNIYVPQGWYLISSTLKMRPNTCLIGLHPFATQLVIKESSPEFSGFGTPQAMLESSTGGFNILNGIGLNTNSYNYRAVGLKWMAGANSYVNDVKFVGGHGSLTKPDPKQPEQPRNTYRPPQSRTEIGKDLAWDNQYWSFWVTQGGGGTFKDIWTASTFATSGFYVNNTSTTGRVYAMSIEHHVRNEVRMKNIANWKFYAFQLEEESREGTECQPVELDNCKNLIFANIYMFRVIRINEPYHNSIRLWNCENIELLNLHNYSQIKYTTDIPVYDVNKDIQIRPWELQRLVITGREKKPETFTDAFNKVEEIAGGFEFIEGITHDSKGNIYFCENRMRRIYKWSVESNSLSLVTDFQWKPVSLAFDSEDNLLVLFRYDAQPGYKVNGKEESETLPLLPAIDRAGTSFAGYGNTSFTMRMLSMDPDNPEETLELLPRVPMGTIKNVLKSLYVSNKWRDFHDFNSITVRIPEMCFVAPDSRTIIPHCFDLARGSSLLEAFPGKPFFTSDEYDRRMVKLDVAADGTLNNLQYFVEWGEFGSAVDNEGNLYVADGQIYIFDKKGRLMNTVEVPERPSTMTFGGKDNNELFITGRSKIFRVKIK